MTKLYRAELNDYAIAIDGVACWVSEGSPITVEGLPMVRSGSVLMPARGWTATRAEALRDAADRIDVMVGRLREQSARLRASAGEVTPW